MVTNSRKTSSSGRIRPLNTPKCVEVEEDDRRMPLSVSWNRRKLQVASIEDVWEIADEWWRRAPIARRYYKITTEDGFYVILFHDLLQGGRYKQGG